MGYLVYADGKRHEFDDRILAHVQVVVGSKLRRRECFFLNWAVDADQGSGRTSLWVSPTTPIQFIYRRTQLPALNREWLEALATSSHGPQGLVITGEESIAVPSTSDGGA